MVGNENFSLNLQNDENEQFNLEMQNEDIENFSVDFGEVINIGGGTSDFNELENRPKYNSQEMTGETNIPAVPTKVSDLQNDSEFQTGSQVEEAISSAIAGKQDTLTAGTNISITDNTISATDTTYTAGANITIDSDNKISATDTTYSNFTGTDGQTAGTAGLVPAPAATDADKFLKSDGTWDTAGGGGGPTVVQTTGTSTTDVMSQDATTKMIFNDPSTKYQIKIGAGSGVGNSNNVAIGRNATAAYNNSLAVGGYAWTDANYTTAVGYMAYGIKEGGTALGYMSSTGNTSTYGTALGAHSNVDGTYNYSVALGARSRVTRSGEVNVGTGNGSYGFNSTQYRVIGGVHDPVDNHDAATKGYVDSLVGNIETALHAINNGGSES